MKKDLLSFKRHNKDFTELHTLDYVESLINKYNVENKFETLGFSKAIAKINRTDIHIDIGCGCGWLLYRTHPIFKKLIGIEPSKSIIQINKIITNKNDLMNIEFINEDMIDGLLSIITNEPVFITTSTVLSHIKDSYVIEFLRVLNNLTSNSYLFFDERYDKNIQQNLWHIRRKYWWAKNLPEWQLEFFEIGNNGYKSGIFGTRVGKANVYNKFKPSVLESILWYIDGVRQKILGLIRFIKRLIKIK